jgi:hypothetical protein
MAERLLDAIMPAWDVRDAHRLRIDAPPERVYAAVKAVTVADVPVMMFLLRVRGLPARLAGRRSRVRQADRPLLEGILGEGFVLLAERPNQELVVGTIGQFWRLRGGDRRGFDDAAGFAGFDEAGFAKAAMNFALRPVGGGTLLSTETRVVATDAAARRAFRRYWRVIYPGSALIRWVWLRAIKRRAEQDDRRLRTGVIEPQRRRGRRDFLSTFSVSSAPLWFFVTGARGCVRRACWSRRSSRARERPARHGRRSWR